MVLKEDKLSIKLCHICSNYDNFYIDFMDEQVSRGLDIRVFYFRAIERGLPEVEAPYLDVRLNYNNWNRLFFMYKENRVLRDFLEFYDVQSFQLIHAHTLFSNGYIAYEAKKRFNIPYIVAVRSMDVNLFLKYRLNLRSLGVNILKEAEKIVFISEPNRNHVISKYVPFRYQDAFFKKSVVIPNGINQFYLTNTFKRENILQNRKLKIITVGYVGKRKNQTTVCEVVKKLIEQGIEVEYIVIGKVLDKDVLEKVLSNSFVKYIPYLSKEDLIEEYRKADVFVMPSKVETFGLTYVEAMSQGLPVIYTRGQGFDGYFDEGEVGYSVDSMDIEEIVDKVKKIISDYKRISNNCLLLSKKFNWKDIQDNYDFIYKGILSKPY